MKPTLIALLVSLTLSTAGDDLAKLKIIRRDMIAKAMRPINDNYKKEVQRLLDEAMRAKKTEDVLTLGDELAKIEAIGTYHQKSNKGFAFTLHDDGSTSAGGKWTVKAGRLFVTIGDWSFDVDVKTKDGKMMWRGKDARPESLVEDQ